MASVTIHNLKKVFGGQTVVDGVNIDVVDGEFLVLVGPSGCGKSTTLRMVAGLEGIDGGSIRIGEREVNELHPADRDVAMVFQSYALYPHMNVEDNISYGLRRRGMPKAEIVRRVRDVTAKLRLDELLKRRPAQLSGGQRQRVALGRAIVREPAVFLMDEPLSNLDAKLRVEMRAELTRLHSELGVTTVYVTHDQVEAMTMGDRIVVMNGGRIEQMGRPLDVYRRPASLFVARFLGLPEINVLTGRIERAGSDTTFRSGDIAIPLATSPAGDDEVALGIRPQDLFGSPEAPAAGSNVLGEAVASTVEHHGPESFASCRLGGQQLTVRIMPGAEIRAGTPLFVTIDPSHPHFFSINTGQRLEPLASSKPEERLS